MLLTAAALVGFAANSLLTRGALATHRLDAATFATIRLASGAATLLLLVRLRGRRREGRGSWSSAIALATYAILFTLAYELVNASVGALVLFGGVQVSMIGAGLIRGERPARVDWLGVGLAVVGLLVLTLPGVNAPSLLGTAMMAGAGACWGVYSLAGQSARDPLAETAGNFVRALLPVAAFSVLSLSSAHVTTAGVLLAVASGSLASGVGYSIWYAVLPRLAAWRAGILQTSTPVLTAIAAAGLLGETLSVRLVVAAGLVTVGVILTIVPAWHRN